MRRHPYILTALVGLFLGWVVWLCKPTEYSAVTKISDEYKEVDLAIGINMLHAQIKAATGGDNTGMNEIAIYCTFLDSEDFFRSIANVSLKKQGMTYGQYLGKTDTIEAVSSRINYNYSGRQETLTISVTDRNPLVASEVLDSVTAHLQDFVTAYRHRMAAAALQNAKYQMAATGKKYHQAQRAYDNYTDSHLHESTHVTKSQKQLLEKDASLAYEQYDKAINEYARQQALLKRSYMSFAVVQGNTVPHHSNDFLISYLLSIPIILLFLTYCVRQYRIQRASGTFRFEWGDFFSPWCLTLVVWTGDILLYFLQGTLDPIGPQFITCLTIWLLTFLPCSLLAFWLSRDCSKLVAFDHRQPIDVNKTVFYVFVALSLLMTLLYARTIWNIVSQFDADNLLYNIRILAVGGNESYGLLNYTQGINVALFLVVIWLYPRVSKWVVALIVANNLILEIAMMEKSGILVMILGTLFVLYEQRKIQIRTIGLTFGFIIVFFFFFNMSKEDADSDTSQTFMDFFGMYVTSPLVAFEKLRITISDTFASNTLNDFYPQLLRFGIKIDSISRLQEFVYVPIPTNVYTIMQPFYNDFGRWGVAFFGFFYGCLFGYIYRKFQEGSTLYKCFYTFLVEVIIIQFYNENFLQIFHLVMEMTVVIAILVVSGKISFSSQNQVVPHEVL